MGSVEREPVAAEPVPGSKGLRSGALGMASSIILATASAAPAYSLAATLAFIVALVGVQAPAVVIVAFIPILFVAFGYSALNRRDPDCGTIFTWGSRIIGPRLGFMAGWAIIASFILVMGSLAQVAGQYGFLLFGADAIGSDAANPLVLLAGLAWLALMTWVCYRGIEVAALVQRILLFLEFGMLAVFSIIALIRVYTHSAGALAISPDISWLNPFAVASPSLFVSGVVMMLFIYWGWETSVTVNEETADRRRIPGLSATISTVLLLALYLVATIATIAVAGVGTKGYGLGNPDNANDVLSALGPVVFGTSPIGAFCSHLMILMVLTSAAASTETTILSLGRTMLAMGDYKALPRAFSTVHPKYASPKYATLFTGIAGAIVYIILNFVSNGNMIGDAVSACGLMIAFYYGMTGVSAAWQYRGLPAGEREKPWTRAVLPGLGGVLLLGAGVWSLVNDWSPDSSYTSWTLPFPPHWQIGGVFLIGVGAFVVGFIVMAILNRTHPAFFRGRLAPAAEEPARDDDVATVAS